MSQSTAEVIPVKRRKRTNRSRQQWQSIIAALRTTDLTHKEFCQHHQITTGSLYTWRKVFADSDTPFIDIRDELAKVAVPAAREESSGQWQVELVLSQGMVLRINDGRP